MNALPQRFTGIFIWLTLYLIPMSILIPVWAIFLVDHSSSDLWNELVRHCFGQSPIYASYSQACHSLGAIPILGFIVWLCVYLLEIVDSFCSRVSLSFHLLGAWLVGFLSSFALWYLRWIRIHLDERTALTYEFERAVVFGIIYALIALAATHLLKTRWIKDTPQ